jgi:hydrogenase-4 component B
MNLIGVGLVIVAAGAGAGATAAMLVPVRIRPLTAGLLTVVTGLGGVLAGAAALGGQTWSLTLPNLLPLGQAELAVDPLSGVFLLLIGAVAVAVGIYSVG